MPETKNARLGMVIESSFMDVLETYRRQHALRSTSEAARELMRIGWAVSQSDQQGGRGDA